MKALTALTLGKPVPRAALPEVPTESRMTPIPASALQTDVLFEMFNGALGSMHLGRLLKGHDAGRLVALRKLRGRASAELAAAADLARSVAHPNLIKLLGLVQESNSTYVASEYLSGVTLFELGRAASNRQMPVQPNVAVRIVLDALTAARAAQELLQVTLHAQPVRCIFPECIWIAEFGETFLAELLVAPLLGRASAAGEPEAAVTADVRSAALELTRLVCAGLSADAPLETDLSGLPEELQDVLARALGHGSFVGYQSFDDFIDALASLDESLYATEAEVANELRRLMGTVLGVRQQKLDMLERGSGLEGGQDQADETKFFRLALKAEQRATARPPAEAPPASAPAVPVAAAPAPAPASLKNADPEPEVFDATSAEQLEEPTLLYLREEGDAQHDWQGEAHASRAPSAPTASAPASALDEEPEPEFRSRGKGRVALVVVAAIATLLALRIGWVMHQEHASFGQAWQVQVRSLTR